jgi:hypothetical protein
MKHVSSRAAATAAVSALAITGTVAGLGLSTAGAQAKSHKVMHYVAHDQQGNMAFDDLGAPSKQGPDIGDVVAFTQSLTQHGKTVGRISNAAVGVDHKRHLFQASGSIVVPHGKIQVAGLVTMGTHFRLAVVGGTGAYTGATGWMDFQNKHNRQLITVTLTR